MIPESGNLAGKVATMETPVTIVQPSGEDKKQNNRKYIIIGVVVVAVVLLLVGGMLGGFFLIGKSSENMLKMAEMTFKDEEGKTNKETVKVDVKNKVTEVDVKNEDSEIRTIHDFKRGVTATRAKNKAGATCFITPLNKSLGMDPETLKEYKDDHPNPEKMTDANTDRIEYRTAEEAIEDPSFLGPKINALCKGLKMYWMYPQEGGIDREDDGETDTGTRQKRQVSGFGRQCTTRYWLALYYRSYNRCLLYCCITLFREKVVNPYTGRYVIRYYGRCYRPRYYSRSFPPCASLAALAG